MTGLILFLVGIFLLFLVRVFLVRLARRRLRDFLLRLTRRGMDDHRLSFHGRCVHDDRFFFHLPRRSVNNHRFLLYLPWGRVHDDGLRPRGWCMHDHSFCSGRRRMHDDSFRPGRRLHHDRFRSRVNVTRWRNDDYWPGRRRRVNHHDRFRRPDNDDRRMNNGRMHDNLSWSRGRNAHDPHATRVTGVNHTSSAGGDEHRGARQTNQSNRFHRDFSLLRGFMDIGDSFRDTLAAYIQATTTFSTTSASFRVTTRIPRLLAFEGPVLTLKYVLCAASCSKT